MSARSTKTPDEATYLAEQAEDARAAINQILRDLKSGIAQSADPKKLTARHPYLAVGGAALAGFAAAWLATPNEAQRNARAAAALERERAAPEPAPSTNGHDRKKSGSALWMQLVRLAMPAVTSAVSSMLHSALASRAPATEEQAADFDRSTDMPGAGDAAHNI
jgi:hypothetical protein